MIIQRVSVAPSFFWNFSLFNLSNKSKLNIYMLKSPQFKLIRIRRKSIFLAMLCCVTYFKYISLMYNFIFSSALGRYD